jgi:hypothetical protein
MAKTTKQYNIPVPKKTNKKPKKPLISKEQLETIRSRKDEHVIFSWSFFDRNHELFNMGGRKHPWFLSMMDALKTISKMTFKEFRMQRSDKGLRVHSHNWDGANACFDFEDDWLEQHEEDCLQFSISKANGRVHGFMIENVFYIVWMDPEHNLYPSKNHELVNKYQYPLSDYEILQIENESLKSERDELESLLEEDTNPG